MDALQIPKDNQIPDGTTPQAGEEFFYCLLEDDNLVTSVDITTNKLYDAVASNNEVFLLIEIVTEFIHVQFTNTLTPPRLLPRA